MSRDSLFTRRTLHDRWRSTLALRAYFRGAEYPMGRVRAVVSAWRMSARWPS